MRGDAADFGVTEYLLSGVFNTLAGMSWQLAGDPNAKKPTPYVPPGQKVPEEGLRMRGDLMSIEEMDRRLAPYKPR
jgi:hypothetical protein